MNRISYNIFKNQFTNFLNHHFNSSNGIRQFGINYEEKNRNSLIKELKKRTGANFLQCKQALIFNQNDINDAQKWIKSNQKSHTNEIRPASSSSSSSSSKKSSKPITNSFLPHLNEPKSKSKSKSYKRNGHPTNSILPKMD